MCCKIPFIARSAWTAIPQNMIARRLLPLLGHKAGPSVKRLPAPVDLPEAIAFLGVGVANGDVAAGLHLVGDRAAVLLVEQPFQRLIAEEKLIAYPYDGFWAPMDTLKDKQLLDSLVENGRAPWALWEPLDAPSGEPVSVIT